MREACTRFVPTEQEETFSRVESGLYGSLAIALQVLRYERPRSELNQGACSPAPLRRSGVVPHPPDDYTLASARYLTRSTRRGGRQRRDFVISDGSMLCRDRLDPRVGGRRARRADLEDRAHRLRHDPGRRQQGQCRHRRPAGRRRGECHGRTRICSWPSSSTSAASGKAKFAVSGRTPGHIIPVRLDRDGRQPDLPAPELSRRREGDRHLDRDAAPSALGRIRRRRLHHAEADRQRLGLPSCRRHDHRAAAASARLSTAAASPRTSRRSRWISWTSRCGARSRPACSATKAGAHRAARPGQGLRPDAAVQPLRRDRVRAQGTSLVSGVSLVDARRHRRRSEPAHWRRRRGGIIADGIKGIRDMF